MAGRGSAVTSDPPLREVVNSISGLDFFSSIISRVLKIRSEVCGVADVQHSAALRV